MSIDNGIKRSFEIADDGMQGIVGYFHYVKACQNIAEQSEIIKKLPSNQNRILNEFERAIKITYEWERKYDPTELCQTMQKVFLSHHARIALISLISIFEGALKNFINRLLKIKKIRNHKHDGYKKRLRWVFDIVKESKYGPNSMINRIPSLCLNVDHARRVRNLWMHNNGLFNEKYGTDGISINGLQPITVSEYKTFLDDKSKLICFILNPEAFKDFSFSHIELLHQLHDIIQKFFFGQTESYNYEIEHKKIEWNRLLGEI